MKKCYICGKDIDGGVVVDKECVDKLISENKRLQALENDSEWVKLPCKVGDMVWFIAYMGSFGICVKIKQRIVNNIFINKNGVRLHSARQNFYDENLWGYFGDTVFLTQAEAEAKLAELKGANENE